MAITVSAPIAHWRGAPASGGTIVSSSFTPANSSLLVVGVLAYNSGTTLNVSGGSLTWSNRVENDNAGYGATAAWFTAPVTTGASMTVTVTRTTGVAELCGMVYVVTGHDSVSPVDITGTAENTVTPWNPTLFTATAIGRAFYCAVDVNGGGSGGATSTDIEESALEGVDIRNFWAYKESDHAVGSVSGNLVTTAVPAWVLAAIAIKAGAASATALPRRALDGPFYGSLRGSVR